MLDIVYLETEIIKKNVGYLLVHKHLFFFKYNRHCIFYSIFHLGIKAHLTSWGISEEKITEFDWWENINYKGVEFVSTPARHFSGRGITNRNSTLWCSWVLKSEKKDKIVQN